MTHTARSLRWAPLTVVLTAVLTTAGCGFDPAAVPVPGTGVPGPTYSIDIEFTDALNLPRRAKVVANGIQVGTVTSMCWASGYTLKRARSSGPGC
ncbi:MlaD family protein, partial [Gordonia aichiensis]